MVGELREEGGKNKEVFNDWRLLNFHELNIQREFWDGPPTQPGSPQLQYGPGPNNEIRIWEVTGIEIVGCSLHYLHEDTPYAYFEIDAYGQLQ